MIPLVAKDEFWSVVEECLQEIHGLSLVDAVQKTRTLRQQLRKPPAGIPSGLADDLIYHEDPFEIACDLAGHPLDIAQHRATYEAIVSRHEW